MTEEGQRPEQTKEDLERALKENLLHVKFNTEIQKQMH